jgi:putative transposase
MANSPDVPCPEALFRFYLVSQVRSREQAGMTRAEAVAALAAQRHSVLDRHRVKVSARTLYRWLAAYEARGDFSALVPARRKQREDSAALPPALIEALVEAKRSDAQASVPELIRQVREQGLIAPGQRIDRTTVWRHLRRRGLATARARHPKTRDCRRFAYAHRMDLVLCDGKHFRAGPKRLRRVALVYLDDATRFGLEVVVGTAETTALFLRGLYRCVLAYGRMSGLYVDNGSGFIALDSLEVARKLKLHLIHGSAGYPQGHGLIERFNRTLTEQVLRGLAGQPEVDSDCAALELRLRHFLRERYNRSPHAALAGETPEARFLDDPRRLRFYDTTDQVRQAFVLHRRRRVSNDHVVSVGSVAYEVPRGYAGSELLLYHHLLDGTVAMLHEGRLLRLAPVDALANARSGRARTHPEEPPAPIPPKTAAQLAFERDLAPVVDPDGGFIREEDS